MNLTNEQRLKIESLIPNPTCPLCGNNVKQEFLLANEILDIPIYDKDYKTKTLMSMSDAVEMAGISCLKCGHTTLINLGVLERIK